MATSRAFLNSSAAAPHLSLKALHQHPIEIEQIEALIRLNLFTETEITVADYKEAVGLLLQRPAQQIRRSVAPS